MSAQRVPNFAKALEYLKEQLAQGTTLAKLVLTETDFSRGTFFTLVPQGTDLTQIDFRRQTMRLSGEQMIFARVIKSFISGGGTVLLQDNVVENVGHGEDAGQAVIYEGLELYWKLSSKHLSSDELLVMLRTPVPYPSAAFFSTPDIVRSQSELARADLEAIVKKLAGASVGAFDEESYLVWWREDLMPLPPSG